MKKICFLFFSALLFTHFASAGGLTNPCQYSNPVLLSSNLTISNDQALLLKVTVTQYDYLCEAATKGQAKVVNAAVSSVDGDSSKVPNFGYISGSYEAFDSDLNSIELKKFPGSYFVISSYPFANEMKTLRVSIDHFPETILQF